MAGSWQSVHGTVGLGSLEVPPPAITDTPSALIEPDRDAVRPMHGGAVRAGGIRVREATPAIAGPVFAPLSVRDSRPDILLAEQALTPSARFDIPRAAVELGTAILLYDWDVFPAGYAPGSPELQPSPEPRRIWNRTALGLPDCVLGKADVRRGEPGIRRDRRAPEDCVALAPEIREPEMGLPSRLDNQGLPQAPEKPMKQDAYAPSGTIRETRQIGPKLRVPLPALPRVR